MTDALGRAAQKSRIALVGVRSVFAFPHMGLFGWTQPNTDRCMHRHTIDRATSIPAPFCAAISCGV